MRSLRRIMRDCLARLDAAMVVLLLLGAAAGCGHYRGVYPLAAGLQQQARGDIAVGGLLDRRGGANGTNAAQQSLALAQQAGAVDASGRLGGAEIALLLSGPAELLLNAPKLAALHERLGHRYVLVGEAGREPVAHVLFWDLFIVVPTPYIVLWFNIPVEVSREDAVAHATRVLRIVDLATATVVGESFALLRDAPEEGEFSESEMGAGLTEMGLR